MFKRYNQEIPYEAKLRVLGWTPYLDGTLRIDVDILVKNKNIRRIIYGTRGMAIGNVY